MLPFKVGLHQYKFCRTIQLNRVIVPFQSDGEKIHSQESCDKVYFMC